MSHFAFLVVILALVLIHEFGHFIIAKRAVFASMNLPFGFPPKIWGKKWGETTYSFNALPLGGYVKIYGENPGEVTEGADLSRSFTHKSRWIQGFVLTGGVIFNLLLAWLLISTTLMIGVPAVVDSDMVYPISDQRVMVTGIHEKSPAEESAMKAGDYLLSVGDGNESVIATSPEVVTDFISAREGQPLTVSFEHNGVSGESLIAPVSGIVPEHPAIGIYMDMVGTLKLPVHIALFEGLKRTYLYTELTAVGIAQFLSTAVMGQSDFSQVAGPVGIVNAVGDAADAGIVNLLFFTAIISINLAVINVLPFPALDGGRLLFVVIEGITRRPIKAQVVNVLNFTGFALLMLLMVVVTYHDIAK